MGNENFEGGLNTKKYIALTKVSKATAIRDITSLIEYGCIKQIDGTQGRNIRYEVNVQVLYKNFVGQNVGIYFDKLVETILMIEKGNNVFIMI